MPALQFPASPAHLGLYTDPNQAVWQYDSDSTVWDVITSTTRKVFSGVKASTAAAFDLTATFTDVPFNTVEFNIDNYYSDNNVKSIAPTTGFYRVLVSLFSDSSGTGSSYTARIYKNTTIIVSTVNVTMKEHLRILVPVRTCTVCTHYDT